MAPITAVEQAGGPNAFFAHRLNQSARILNGSYQKPKQRLQNKSGPTSCLPTAFVSAGTISTLQSSPKRQRQSRPCTETRPGCGRNCRRMRSTPSSGLFETRQLPCRCRPCYNLHLEQFSLQRYRIISLTLQCPLIPRVFICIFHFQQKFAPIRVALFFAGTGADPPAVGSVAVAPAHNFLFQA